MQNFRRIGKVVSEKKHAAKESRFLMLIQMNIVGPYNISNLSLIGSVVHKLEFGLCACAREFQI